MAAAVFAASPIPSKFITIILPQTGETVGSVEISESITPHVKTKLFEDEQEILASISTNNFYLMLNSVKMTTVTSTNRQEKPYETIFLVDETNTSLSQHLNLDADPPLELLAYVKTQITGFATKLDSGNIVVFGQARKKDDLTTWIELGGPLIGFKFIGARKPMSLIIGDICKPKYFGARKLTVRLGEKRQVQFYWQESLTKYYSICLSKGLFYIQNSGKLFWVVVDGQKATIFPGIDNFYSSLSYLSMSYRGETKLLKFSIFVLYQLPALPTSPEYPPITSSFGDIEEVWLTTSSSFKFSDNYKEEGRIFFGEFEQGTYQYQGCTTDCNPHKYILQAQYSTYSKYAVYSIEEEVIVTSMKRIYQSIRLAFRGTVFTGVSFRDDKGLTVTSNKVKFKYKDKQVIQQSSSTSLVCGKESSTSTSSGWMPIVGPIKGSYLVKVGEDNYDYISDFGLFVQDPCQAFDNKQSINLNPTKRTVKDLKYHDGTDSQFWLPKVCQDDKALRLVDVSAFPFLRLRNGNLAVLSTPPDQCTRLKLQHNAPDNSSVTNLFYLHTVSKHEAMLEECSPHHGNCQPKIRDLALTGTAGLSKTITLFNQDSVESYFRACEGALFDLTGAPFWLNLTNSSFLVIDPPNDINIPRKYQFWIGIWAVTLQIDAPCSANYLQGLKEQGHVAVYIDKVVVLAVAFELDDKENSWEKVCGSIQRAFIRDAPIFVKYNEHTLEIEIKPQNKADQGLHIILVEMEIKSMKFFNALQILVKLPVTYIDPHLKPFFRPPLIDELKLYAQKWQDDLSSIRDPAQMFAYVSKTRISPQHASKFVQTFFSSDDIANRTRIFVIDENDWNEKTGNVSFFVEISAFNQNYSVWQGHTQYSRSQDWRWRKSEQRFNLTIIHPDHAINQITFDNICKKRFIANYKKQIKIGDETINICKPTFSRNITMTSTAQVKLTLGDSMSTRSEINRDKFQTNFKFIIAEEQLNWKLLNYFIKEEFTSKNHPGNSDTNAKRSQITLLSVQLIIKDPWNIQKQGNLIIEICEPKIVQYLRGNCLQLSYNMPDQIYNSEKTIVTVIFIVLLTVNMILTILNSVLLMQQDWNLPPSYFSNLLLICHMLATGIKLPGAVTDFNQRVFEAVALKFDQLILNSVQISYKYLNPHMDGLNRAGYKFISPTSNLGITLLTLFYLTKFFFICSNTILFFVKKKNRCGKLSLGRRCIRITENISTGSYFNFEMSSSIVQITSAFVYLRFAKTYKSTTMISETILWQQDFFVAVTQLWVPVYLCIHLLATANNKEWWGLSTKLLKERSCYAKRHRALMCFPHSEINDQTIRDSLTNLEKFSNKQENRFVELRKTIGSVQSENIYPSVVGLERSLLYVLLKLIMPVLLAAILVFVDTVWIAFCSLLILLLGYFVLQIYFVQANISTRELFTYGLIIFVGYISVFLFIQENHTERNYFGWIYIVVLTVHFSFTGVEQLRTGLRRLKQILVGEKRSVERDEFFLKKLNQVEVDLSLNSQGFNVFWSVDIFSTLAFGVWKREDLCHEMRYWIKERIRNLPEFYKQKILVQKYLQAASDIFFCNIHISYLNDGEYFTIKPRQQENLMLSDCGRILKILFTDSKYGVLSNDETILMRCPFPKQGNYNVSAAQFVGQILPKQGIDGPVSYRDKNSQLIDVQLDEEISQNNWSSTLILNEKKRSRNIKIHNLLKKFT